MNIMQYNINRVRNRNNPYYQNIMACILSDLTYLTADYTLDQFVNSNIMNTSIDMTYHNSAIFSHHYHDL